MKGSDVIRLKIVGMSCAACSARVERALKSLPGVTNATVNLMTNSAQVEGDVSVQELVQAVQRAGYDAKPRDLIGKESNRDLDQENPNIETKRQYKRLVSSAILAALLFYLSTCVMTFGCPTPGFLATPGAIGLAQLLLATGVVTINRRLFYDGLSSFWRLSPNMNALVALGSGASYLYSVVGLFIIVNELAAGNLDVAKEWTRNLSFESTAVILVFITLGKTLETRSKGKTTSALKELAELAPPDAIVVRDGKETLVKVEDMRIDDVFLLKPGGRVPADGIVLDGVSSVDESALTGESLPIDKTIDSEVAAGTLNLSGFLRCKASRVGQNTALSQIIQLTADASASKAPVARLADQISSIFVPAVVLIATLTFVVWLCCGSTIDVALKHGVSVLLISCPCALGLATPAAIIVGSGVGARHGILFKTAEALENAGKSKIVVFDKTGVVTEGKPVATDVLAVQGVSEDDLLSFAGALEAKSEHPLAKAVVELVNATERTTEYEVEGFQTVPGNGLEGIINGKRAAGGKLSFIQDSASVPQEFQRITDGWGTDGKTSLFFEYDGRFLGAIAVADSPKSTSAEAIENLKSLKKRVVMLTGDSRRVAEAVGKHVGIDEIYAEVLPSGKEQKVRELSGVGRVAFVGDGINDAPALSRADVGFAVGAGTNIAIDAADVVLLNNSLNDLCRALRLSRATLTNIKENLFWAFIYNVVGIPLAAGVFTPFLGWTLNPIFGALAMSLSSFCVVSNALRLNFVKLDESKRRKNSETSEVCPLDPRDAPRINVSQDKTCISNKESIMKKTMKIEGMMCGHCEARVKKTLEALPFVASAEASHATGEAVVELSSVPSDVDAQLKNAVEAQDYTVKSID